MSRPDDVLRIFTAFGATAYSVSHATKRHFHPAQNIIICVCPHLHFFFCASYDHIVRLKDEKTRQMMATATKMPRTALGRRLFNQFFSLLVLGSGGWMDGFVRHRWCVRQIIRDLAVDNCLSLSGRLSLSPASLTCCESFTRISSPFLASIH